jgi:Asp-tRNA(Asn)/Glu-tRNA(Gln) amidotransferase A subunit family amidase
MPRLSALAILLAGIACSPAAPGTAGPTPPADIVYERSIADLQAAMTSGRATSVQLVDAYLARIRAYDDSGPALNALILVNPSARDEAAALDRERRAGRVRGPLHGIPVILKDNYSTTDMATTAGSVALRGFVPSAEAFQVRKLRDAGAVILAKANMQELASGITNVSSLGGQTCNPYDPTKNPGGSSGGSGVAAAASFAAIAYGSDTCGSIRIPAAFNNVFGLRPTKGLVSITGIIPLSHTQDVAGPLARTVSDLAIGLDAIVGPDPADPATRLLETMMLTTFAASLDTTALRGARIGALTSYFGTEATDADAAAIVRGALDRMRGQGAEVVDITIPGLDSLVRGAGVIDFEFKYDLQDYLAATPGAPISTLAQILERGLFHSSVEASFRRREGAGTRDSEAYRTSLARRDSVRRLVVRFMDENRLDAIAYPPIRHRPASVGMTQAGSNCQLSAVSGLPALSMPGGFTADSLPLGIELLGRPLADARLVAMAYDYEQAVRPRRPPRTTPPLK